MCSGDKFKLEFFCFSTRLSILFVLAADDAPFELTSDNIFDVLEFAESPVERNKGLLDGLVWLMS